MDSKVIVVIVLAAIVAIGVGIFGISNLMDDDENSDVITYDGNGGKCEGESKVTSKSTTVVSNLFDNGDKLFIEWNTRADGKGKMYNDGDTVSLGTTLYAIWADYVVSCDIKKTNVDISIPIMFNDHELYLNGNGYQSVSDTNKVYLTVFDDSFSNITFKSYDHDNYSETIKVSAIKDGKSYECTFEITHNGFSSPMFDGSDTSAGGKFKIQVIGNCDANIYISIVGTIIL